MTLSRRQANFALLLAAFLWGAGNVAQKTILDDIGPFTAIALRCAIAFSIVAPFAFHHRRDIARIDAHGWRLLAAASMCFAVAVTLLQVGYGYTTVTNASFLANMTTVIVPFAAWALLRHKPTPIIFMAGAVALAGAYLMSGGKLDWISGGDVLCIAAALCYSFWIIALGEFGRLYGQACLVTAAQFGLTAILTLPFAIATENTNAAAIAAALPELIMLGVASTGLAYLLQGIAQKYTSVGEAAIITSAESLFGAAGGMMLLGERLDFAGQAGALLMMLGILAAQWPRRQPPLTSIDPRSDPVLRTHA
jgi:drug/metabolite transporter (DMT)-like permease